MIKTLTTHGNSAALIIDKAILELLGISMSTPLKITTDGKSLIAPGLRDYNLLCSALAMPEASFAGDYLHIDINGDQRRLFCVFHFSPSSYFFSLPKFK